MLSNREVGGVEIEEGTGRDGTRSRTQQTDRPEEEGLA